jgi:hypothetical protein
MTKQERIIAKQSELINHLSEAFIYQSNDELVEFHFKRGKLESELKELQSEPDKDELREDLKQYITNALYYAHDDADGIDDYEFDKWVDEQINGIDEYFKSKKP